MRSYAFRQSLREVTVVKVQKSGKVLVQFWKGGESLRARARGGKSELHKARCRATPPIPGSGNRTGFLNPESAGIRAGGPGKAGLTDSATENRPPPRFGAEARVKRWSKSPPLQE